MAAPASLPFDPELPPLRERLPEGSCDCHFHVFEDTARYPVAAGSSYRPAMAPMPSYQRLMAASGLARAVLVQPSVYGSDHRLFMDLLRARGEWLRGVAVARADTPETELAAWHALGARGARINALFAAGAPLAEIEAIAARIRPLGWHLQVCIDVDAEPALLPRIVRLGVPVVVDHMGHLPAHRAPQSRGFADLLALLREGQVWAKLSGPYRLTEQRAGFADVRPMVDRLLAANAGRLVWGSDWPHPAIAAPMVNDAELVRLALQWLQDAGLRQRILVDNPQALYWR